MILGCVKLTVKINKHNPTSFHILGSSKIFLWVRFSNHNLIGNRSGETFLKAVLEVKWIFTSDMCVWSK